MTTPTPPSSVQDVEGLIAYLRGFDPPSLAHDAADALEASNLALTSERARAETAEEALKAIAAKAFTARVEEGWTLGTTSIIDIASTALTRIAALKDPHSNAD